MAPRLSLIVPTHRRPHNVSALLKSLAHQTLDPRQVEVILVSNFPDRRLHRLVRRERACLPIAIHLFTVGRLGVNHARNLGLESARGDVALMLDDDCYLPDRGFLQRVLDLHAEAPEAVALGGAYLSPPSLGAMGTHYNWICNKWLNAQFDNSRPTTRLLGGAVSYKLTRLRELRLKLDETIRYGGAETEFHERLVRGGHKMRYHPRLSVIHDCDISAFDLTHKAFMQGFAKARRVAKAGGGTELPLSVETFDNNFWDLLLSGSFPGQLYRHSFANGEVSYMANSQLPSRGMRFLSFIATYTEVLALGYAGGPPLYRYFAGDEFATVRLAWIFRRWGATIRMHTKRLFSRFYWNVINRSYWSVREGMIRSYWAAVRQLDRAKGSLRRAFWRLFPVFEHVRYSWNSPRALIGGGWRLKMPLPNPSFKTEGRPLWAVRLDTDLERQEVAASRLAAAMQALGLTAIEVGATEFSTRPELAPYLERLACEEIACHVLHTPDSPAAPLPTVKGMRHIAVIEAAKFHMKTPEVREWLRGLSGGDPVSLLIRLEEGALSNQVKNLLREIPRLQLDTIAVEIQGVAPVNGEHDYFSWFSRFSAECEVLNLKWTPYYRHGQTVASLVRQRPQPIHAGADPLISIVLGTGCDKQEQLQITLASLGRQTLPKESFEILHVKPDKTLPAMDARTLCLREARGRYIQFVNPGEALPPRFLAELAGEMESADVVTTAPVDWSTLARIWRTFGAHGYAVHRRHLMQWGALDSRLTEPGMADVDLALRLRQAGLRFTLIKQNLIIQTHSAPGSFAPSALALFLARPEGYTFALCQDEFAPTLGQCLSGLVWPRSAPRIESPAPASAGLREAHAQ